MNIRDVIILRQSENKAIKREMWSDRICIYHRTDNIFYWFIDDIECDIQTGSVYNYCVADLQADDWKLSNLTTYHGPNPI